MPIRVITTLEGTTFEVVTELVSLDPAAPNRFATRAQAEAILQHAWARDALGAWNTLAEIAVMWRAFAELDVPTQRRIAAVIDERLRDLDDVLWTLIEEGPMALTATAPGRGASSHAIEIDGKPYPTDPESIVDSTAERLRIVEQRPF